MIGTGSARKLSFFAAMLFATSTFVVTSAAGPPPTCLGEPATIYGQSGAINGTPEHDVIVGSEQSDNINGLGGTDVICGMGANDNINGGAGTDILGGGTGNDIINGGGGEDTASYRDSPTYIKANLGTGKVFTPDAAEIDSIESVEDIVGTELNDVLTGDSGRNVLFGLGGDDRLSGKGNGATLEFLYGGDGNDILSGGSGGDWLRGESGDDTASYRGAPGTVLVDLRPIYTNGRGKSEGAWGTDEIDTVENVAGSDFDDDLVGTDGANELLGFKGNDRIQGLEAPDLIDGGADDDLMYSGPGNDTVIGGDGDSDTSSYEDAYGDVTANLTTGMATPDGHGTSDSLIEVENLIASYGTVNFTGDNGPNYFILCDKADTADGMGGNDTIFGGLLEDTINGGPGDDLIYGQDANDTINGGAGNDRIAGSYGNDTLDGEAGHDFTNGGSGNDTCFAEEKRNCELPEDPVRSGRSSAPRAWLR